MDMTITPNMRRSKRLKTKRNNDQNTTKQHKSTIEYEKDRNIQDTASAVSGNGVADCTVDQLPDVIWVIIFGFLTTEELGRDIPLVCRSFSRICTEQDGCLWKDKYTNLFHNKLTSISNSIQKHAAACKGYRQKYAYAEQEFRRTTLTKEELCSFDWAFRFKTSAGDQWTSFDPYWTGGDNDGDDDNHSLDSEFHEWIVPRNEHECMMRRFHPDRTISNPGVRDALDDLMELANYNLKWRFTKTRKGSSSNTILKGQFLQVNRWPSAGIERSDDGGWIMHNQWVAYVSPPSNMRRFHDQLENDVERWY